MRGTLRAQRLPASEVFAPSHGLTGIHSGLLCSTPFGIRGICTEDNFADVIKPDGCSTPFGIRGICTRRFKQRVVS